MNILIIEDELLPAEDLASCIKTIRPQFVIERTIHSVAEGISYFQTAPLVDLIFSDIQLGDGLSFDLFSAFPPTAPVVFCTAYDQYAIPAFKANGIDYILKPFLTRHVEDAICKFESLRSPQLPDLAPLIRLLQRTEPSGQPAATKNSVLVRYKDRIKAVPLSNVALIFTRNNQTWLVPFDGNMMAIDETLEELTALNLPYLFRANRQYLVHRKAIKELRQHFGRKLQLDLAIITDEIILVSKERSPLLLAWLQTN